MGLNHTLSIATI